LTEFFFVN